MSDLITSLSEKAGITAEQASKVVDHLKDYVKEKFPMMAGAVDNLFAATPTPAAVDAIVDPKAPAVSHTVLDNISDIIPGETGEKVENFVKDSAVKVEEAFDQLKDKIGNLFGHK